MTEEEEFEFRARLEAEQGATPQKSVAPTASKGFWDEHPDLRTTMRIGLPTVGAIAGGLAAAPLTGGASVPASLATLLAFEGLGSLGGEAVNQAIGVNKPDFKEQAYATIAPMVGRTASGVAAWLGKTLTPGLSEALRASITPEMRELPAKVLGLEGKSSKNLYDQLKQHDLTFRIKKFDNLNKTIADLGDEVSKTPWENLRKAAHAEGMEGLFEQIGGSIGKGGQGLTFEEADAARKILGKLGSSTPDAVQRGQYQQVHKALLSDMESAPMPAGGGKALEAWKAARNIAKREHAHLELNKATESAIDVKEGVDIINPNKVVKWLKSDAGVKAIKDRVGPEEYRQIMNEYRYWAAQVGSPTGKVTGAALGSLAGSLHGYSLGGPSGGSFGGVGGGSMGWLVAQEISKAMLTSGGRTAVRRLIGHPSKSNFRRMMMASGTAATAAYTPTEDEEE